MKNILIYIFASVIIISLPSTAHATVAQMKSQTLDDAAYWQIDIDHWLKLSKSMAMEQYRNGQIMEAIQTTQASLFKAKQILGENSIEALDFMGNLGALLSISHSRKEGEAMMQQANIKRKALGLNMAEAGLQALILADQNTPHRPFHNQTYQK